MLAQERPHTHPHTHNEAEMHSERRVASVPQRCTRCPRRDLGGDVFHTSHAGRSWHHPPDLLALPALPPGGSAVGR